MTIVTFAKEKSEYSYCLLKFINLKLKPKERYQNFRRMQEIEESLREQGDEIAIIISTIKTSKDLAIPAMTLDNFQS